MIANIIILALIAGYCIFLIRKGIRNWKEGKSTGCIGCGGNCAGCHGCRHDCMAARPGGNSRKAEG